MEYQVINNRGDYNFETDEYAKTDEYEGHRIENYAISTLTKYNGEKVKVWFTALHEPAFLGGLFEKMGGKKQTTSSEFNTIEEAVSWANSQFDIWERKYNDCK